jgi:DNA-binding NarL/FixJ family response regulator
MIRIAIVEDDPVIRGGLRMLIDGSDGFTCVGAYASGEEALSNIPGAGADVVLMDIHLPGLSGIECTAALTATSPHPLIMMLTALEEDDTVFAALRAGAIGYLVKKTPPAKLLEAVTDLCNGGSPMSGRIARRVVEAIGQTPSPTVRSQSDALSPREREILEHLSRGLRYREIADALFISIDTVRTHIRNIYEKLQVRSRTEALNKTLRS